MSNDGAKPVTQTKYLTDRQLAERWSVSRDTIWRWRREGRIPNPIHLGPNSTRWKLNCIEKHEAAQEAGA